MEINRSTKMQQMMKYRWFVFACITATYFLVFFHRLSLGPLKEDLIKSYHMSAAAFANLGSMYFYAYMLMQIPTGILADTLGPRLIISVGSLVTALGTFIFAFSHTISHIFIGRFLIGLGVSVIYVSILKIYTQWFKESEFGTLVGLTGFIGNMGGIVAQTPLAFLIVLFSWRCTFTAVGLLSFILAILCFAFVRNKPQDLGFPSVNERKSNVIATQPEASIKEGLFGVLKNYRTWLIFIVLTCYSGAYLSFAGTWGISYFRTVYQLDNIKASEYITLLVLGISIGYLMIGFISDKLKSRKIPLVFLGLMVNILWFVMLYYDGGHLPMQAIRITMLLLGISTICYSLTFSLGKEVNHPRYAGMAVSIVNLGAFVGGAVVPVIVGKILDQYQGLLTGVVLYRKGFIVCLVLNGIALLTSLFINETHCKNIYFSSTH